MKSKVLALGMSVLALSACDMLGGEKTAAAKKPAEINAQTTDDQKFAYMLGAQFGGQNFIVVPLQTGEEFNKDALYQGIRDAVRASKDTSFQIQMNVDSMNVVGRRYNSRAGIRMQKARPDSATFAALGGDMNKAREYTDSVLKAMPLEKAAPSTGAAVVINDSTSDNVKFSYIMGAQFGNQFNYVGKQFNTSFDEEYFILGVKDAAAKVEDSTKTMALPEDTLNAIGERYAEKQKVIMEEMRKKQQEEQEKLKAEVAALKGDTLANGMPAKINYSVKVTGVSLKTESLEGFAGKPLLLFYFSSTCGHCAHAAPQIAEIAKEYNPKGLTTVAVASGSNNKTGIRKFMDNSNFEGVVNVTWDEKHQFGELYSDGYVPKVYLVNPDGTYKLYAGFESQKEELIKEIGELLNGKKVEWNPEPVKAEEISEAPAAAPAPAAK